MKKPKRLLYGTVSKMTFLNYVDELEKYIDFLESKPNRQELKLLKKFRLWWNENKSQLSVRIGYADADKFLKFLYQKSENKKECKDCKFLIEVDCVDCNEMEKFEIQSEEVKGCDNCKHIEEEDYPCNKCDEYLCMWEKIEEVKEERKCECGCNTFTENNECTFCFKINLK